jgi:hypothetical protein
MVVARALLSIAVVGVAMAASFAPAGLGIRTAAESAYPVVAGASSTTALAPTASRVGHEVDG